MACLAGILIVVAYHMSEWRQFKSQLKGNRADAMILLTTFFLTVIFDLVIAIEVGIVLSAFILMKRMSDTTKVQLFTKEEEENLFEEEKTLPEGATMYEIHGALFFGAAQAFQDTINRLPDRRKVLILRMRNVLFIDATGIYRLKEMITKFKDQGRVIILSGVSPEVENELEKGEIYSVIDKKNVTPNIEQAIIRARQVLETLDK